MGTDDTNTLFLNRSLKRSRRLQGEFAWHYRQGHDVGNGKVRGDLTSVIVGCHRIQHGVPLDDFQGEGVRSSALCFSVQLNAGCSACCLSLSRRKAALQAETDASLAKQAVAS